ncbi:MAG: MerR family transcriptional regulator [Lachnospiraceae bacterium]|nr:MerR family transcriptional regulator [Lachnospiraceae bacterium]
MEEKNWKLSEVSKITGLSRKALQEYDRMELLQPTSKTEGGYWLYDSKALQKAKLICSFNMAGYKRTEIKKILDEAEGDNVQILRENYGIMIERLKKQREELDTTIRSLEVLNYSSTCFEDKIRELGEYLKSKGKYYSGERSLADWHKHLSSTLMYMEPEEMERVRSSVEPSVLFMFMGAYLDEDIHSELMKEKMDELLKVWDDFILRASIPENAKEEFNRLEGKERLCSVAEFIFMVTGSKDEQGNSACGEMDALYGEGTYEKVKQMIKAYLE